MNVIEIAGKSGSNLANDTHSAAKRQTKIVKKPRVPRSNAQKTDKPIFFNHLVTGVNRKPRKPASTIGRKRSTAILKGVETGKDEQSDHSNGEPEINNLSEILRG
jgi:hypothetical protein